MRKKIFTALWVLVGAFLCCDAVFLMFLSRLDVGHILALAIGSLFIFYGIFYDKIYTLTQYGILNRIKILCFVLMIGALGMMLFLASYGGVNNVNYKEDAIIILGSRIVDDKVTNTLAYRLDSAIQYLDENPAAVVVVSGGRGYGESVSEAEAMRRYLIDRGIDDSAILLEDRATSTYENFIYSREILDAYFDGPYRISFVTNNFHIYRSFSFAKQLGMSATKYSAKLDWYAIPICYMREVLTVIKFWIFRS